ncbi:hypothetical protein [Phycicoccus sp. 3266]|uniref:hypothetical protein n=1 Tax=Phycicoccus sp. 3266 TaxID=2817751 RepID=UPI002860228F|nr:hypothetical protein [Phycicoccus sp. 3266]MDR6864551.1 hypothetical protein [Phycicoccus sp. 3266]
MARFTITTDRIGVGASPSEAVAGDPTAFVLPLPRGTAAVAVAGPAVALAFAAFVAVMALLHLSLGGLLIACVVAGGAWIALQQGLRRSSVPQVAAGPGGLFLSGLGMYTDRCARVVPWAQIERIVVCRSVEPTGSHGVLTTLRPALALVAAGGAEGAAALVPPPTPGHEGLTPLVPGSVDVSALDPRALEQPRRERPDVAALLGAAAARPAGSTPVPGATARLPYQRLAHELEARQRADLTDAVHRFAPHVQVVDGPDVDTRGPAVWVGRPTG